MIKYITQPFRERLKNRILNYLPVIQERICNTYGYRLIENAALIKISYRLLMSGRV